MINQLRAVCAALGGLAQTDAATLESQLVADVENCQSRDELIQVAIGVAFLERAKGVTFLRAQKSLNERLYNS